VYLKLLRKHHLRPAAADNTTTPSAPTRGYTSMAPLHLSANAE
jgi:hypothetical protein